MMNQLTIISKINDEIKKNGIISLIGPLIGMGENMKCYEIKAHPNYIIKLLRNNNNYALENRRRKTYIYTSSIPSSAVCPTYLISPNSGLQYYEIQEKVKETLFDKIVGLLLSENLATAFGLMNIVHDFEKTYLWRNGIFMLDTKSYLMNFSFQNEKLILIDHDGLEDGIELIKLYLESPWKLFRYQGTLEQLTQAGISKNVLKTFENWYFENYFKFYKKSILNDYFNYG